MKRFLLLLLLFLCVLITGCALCPVCPDGDRLVRDEKGYGIIVPKGLFSGPEGYVSEKIYREWLDRVFQEMKTRAEQEREI